MRVDESECHAGSTQKQTGAPTALERERDIRSLLPPGGDIRSPEDRDIRSPNDRHEGGTNNTAAAQRPTVCEPLCSTKGPGLLRRWATVVAEGAGDIKGPHRRQFGPHRKISGVPSVVADGAAAAAGYIMRPDGRHIGPHQTTLRAPSEVAGEGAHEVAGDITGPDRRHQEPHQGGAKRHQEPHRGGAKTSGGWRLESLVLANNPVPRKALRGGIQKSIYNRLVNF